MFSFFRNVDKSREESFDPDFNLFLAYSVAFWIIVLIILSETCSVKLYNDFISFFSLQFST